MSESRCEVCRHPYWTCHIEAVRLNARTREAVKGRCDDCTACLDRSGAVTESQFAGAVR